MSGEWHGGKGSNRRTSSISHEEWSTRWDAIFQRDLPKEDMPSTEDALRSNRETQEAINKQSPSS